MRATTGQVMTGRCTSTDHSEQEAALATAPVATAMLKFNHALRTLHGSHPGIKNEYKYRVRLCTGITVKLK